MTEDEMVGGIIDSVSMFEQTQEDSKVKGAWPVAVHGVTKSQT